MQGDVEARDWCRASRGAVFIERHYAGIALKPWFR